MNIKISFFATSSSEGKKLKEEFCKIAQTEYNCKVTIYNNGTQKQLFNAAMYDDIVIFDASIEDASGSNYAAATENVKSLQHILIVSRTYLPLNFYGTIEGGAPIYPNSYTNEQIIEWLKKTIKDRFLENVPRKNKGILKYLKAMNEALDFKKRFNNEVGQIFISYRNIGDNYLECLKLKEQIENGEFHSWRKKTVRLISPGEFVYDGELLPEWRHWYGLSIIERWIAASDKVYVYGTEDYADSWWTTGEMMSLIYTPMIDKLRIYDPKTKTVRSEHIYLNILKSLQMNTEQKKRMARWFANCDPATMGPESVKAIMMYQNIPIINKSKYINDEVFKPEFWQNNILHCYECKNNNLNQAKIYRKIYDMFNIDDFLWISRMASNIHIKPEQIDLEAKNGFIKCPKCGTIYNVSEKEPRYLWMPVRFGKSTGPNGSNLITLPTYVVNLEHKKIIS